jgi:hypothetical protein
MAWEEWCSTVVLLTFFSCNASSPILNNWQVSLPSEDKRNPNVFEFGTSYKDILTKLEERGLDKYHHNSSFFFLIALNMTSLPEASTLGVRTFGKCWNATRSSNVHRNAGKTARSSENTCPLSSSIVPRPSRLLFLNFPSSGMMWLSHLTMKFMTWFSLASVFFLSAVFLPYFKSCCRSAHPLHRAVLPLPRHQQAHSR